MDISLFINNFPWNRFDHGGGNSPGLDRNFMKVMALDFMEKHKAILEGFTESKDDEAAKPAISLMDSMNHPRKFTFDGVEY